LSLADGIDLVTIFSPTITLLEDARLVIPPGATAILNGHPQQRLPVTGHLRSSILVDSGALIAYNVDFGPASGTTWGGIRFYQNAMSVLSRSTVTGVLAGTDLGAAPGAVTVYGGAVVLDDSEVSGTTNGDGVHAAGSAAEVTVSGLETLVSGNQGNGVVAAGGSMARVDGLSTVGPNAGAGVVATGSNSRVVLGGAIITQNGASGVSAEYGGSVEFDDEVSVLIDNNAGGLSANKSAEVQAGVCTGEPCGHVAHDIAFNAELGNFDARAENGSVVLAEGNTWGDVTDPQDLVLIVDGSSYISVEPFAEGGGLWSPPDAVRATAPADGPHSLTLGAGPLFAEASRRLAVGDTTGAFQAAASALRDAESPSERRAAFGTALRLLAIAQPPEIVAWIEARTDGVLRPWALRALGVAYAASGRDAGAQALAETLVSEHGASEHGLAGHAALVRLAVDERDQNAATARLAAIVAAAPTHDLTARMAALVAAAFPTADVEAPFASAAAGTDDQAVAVDRVVRVGAVVPNPVRTAAELAISLQDAGRLRADLFDGLGRHVATIHDGELARGVHRLRIETARLAAGRYVLRLLVGGSGREAQTVEVRRITVLR
jgi:hypothetical protein